MYVIAQSAGGKNTSTSLLEPVNILKTKKKRHNSSKTVTCDITQKKPLFQRSGAKKPTIYQLPPSFCLPASSAAFKRLSSILALYKGLDKVSSMTV